MNGRRCPQMEMLKESIISHSSLRIPHSGLRTGEGPQMNAD